MTAMVYTAAQAAAAAQCSRAEIDGACSTGALKASDRKPDSSKRSWRIRPDDLDDWIERGYPVTTSTSERR